MLRASAGAGRGALLTKLAFFASATDFLSIWSLLATLRGPLWPSLGAPLGILVAPGVGLGIPKGALGGAFGRLRALLARRFGTLQRSSGP